MSQYTRRDIKKLTPQVIRELHEAGQRGDEQAFKRLLGKYASHLPGETKETMLEEFRTQAAALREALQKKR
jgi:hypothetical protein